MLAMLDDLVFFILIAIVFYNLRSLLWFVLLFVFDILFALFDLVEKVLSTIKAFIDRFDPRIKSS